MFADRTTPASSLDAIREKLLKYPQLSVVDKGDRITVEAQTPDGFAVSFDTAGDGYTVYMAGWHAHFDPSQIDTALNCFAFGLSDAARLKVHSRGGRDYCWTLEAFEDGEWRTDSTTGRLFFRFWRRSSVRYLRNAVIVADKP